MRNYWIIIIVLLSQSLIGQNSITIFFEEADTFFKKHVSEGQLNYAKIKGDTDLPGLIQQIADQDITTLSTPEKKAFYINAYNLLVINEATALYPTSSVKSRAGFFEKTKHIVAGHQYSLNNFVKKVLINMFQDARLHFVLVCGAKGCPPIINEAYVPGKLEMQIERQTSQAINNASFIYLKKDRLYVSEIFKWYSDDFGGNKNVIPFINKYRKVQVNENASLDYYTYDWGLNDIRTDQSNTTSQGANAYRYVVSAAIPKGGFEFKLFNNLYTQRTGDGSNLVNRSSFFTSSLSALYGVTSRFNAGLEVRYRRVENSQLPSSPLEVFNGGSINSHRSGITAIGPRIRFAPFKNLKDFSVQTTLTFPVGSDLAGDGNRPYIDWNGASFNTQLFNDKSLGSQFSLFTELDILIEDIGGLSRFSTPFTGILSFFPNKKTTLYALSSFSPYWQSDFDYFVQGGLGIKYQLSSSFEIELLATKFSNEFLSSNNGDAATYNIGFRYSY